MYFSMNTVRPVKNDWLEDLVFSQHTTVFFSSVVIFHCRFTASCSRLHNFIWSTNLNVFFWFWSGIWICSLSFEILRIENEASRGIFKGTEENRLVPEFWHGRDSQFVEKVTASQRLPQQIAFISFISTNQKIRLNSAARQWLIEGVDWDGAYRRNNWSQRKGQWKSFPEIFLNYAWNNYLIRGGSLWYLQNTWLRRNLKKPFPFSPTRTEREWLF